MIKPEKTCENCLHNDAPCHVAVCKVLFNGNKPPKSWQPGDAYWKQIFEDKTCHGYDWAVYGQKDDLLIGYYTKNNMTYTTRWTPSGRCFSTSTANLIPREPPIEDTPDFKAFVKTYHSNTRTNVLKKRFMKLKEVFDIKLKKQK